MKSAYLYVRVSTDEQKRKGYSLPEQEDRLLKYCEGNGIKVKGIFREDFSAKNFIRPEWKKLISEIKKNKERGENNILFVKWDRFSRNIQYAYETIGFLRKYNTNAMMPGIWIFNSSFCFLLEMFSFGIGIRFPDTK